ncbi:helix-turn-helix domain-containing protein [Aquiflexum sp.]|uniref:helix-turn-helix domain-containing protein n=1 Tax=Aquiflexum sp. TaxID=1872584 RepID=UPI003593D9E3
MKQVLGYQTHTLVRKVIEKEIEKLGIEYSYSGTGHIELMNDINSEDYNKLKLNLLEYGIYIQSNHQQQMVQRIKDAIDEFLSFEENYNYNLSTYISEKLELNYTYASNLFSENTLITIQSHIILKKIERAKIMMLSGKYSLTEIAYKLNYSSPAHFSGQFKKVTGLTASQFEKIISKRNFSDSEN